MTTWVSQNVSILYFIGAKDDGSGMTSGAVRRAKLQSNRHHQQTNGQLLTGRMPFVSPNQQRHSTERKCFHISRNCSPSTSPGGLATLSWPLKGSAYLGWVGLPGRHVEKPDTLDLFPCSVRQPKNWGSGSVYICLKNLYICVRFEMNFFNRASCPKTGQSGSKSDLRVRVGSPLVNPLTPAPYSVSNRNRRQCNLQCHSGERAEWTCVPADRKRARELYNCPCTVPASQTDISLIHPINVFLFVCSLGV